MTRVLVIGGGISGLALAYRLEQLQPELRVLVLEQQARVGGTIGTLNREGFRVETGPNGFLDTKAATISLSRELGLDPVEASASSRRNRYLFLGGKLRKLPGGLLSFLGQRMLSWKAKLRILAEFWNGRRSSGADESIEDFVCRHWGQEVAEKLVDAVVTGIYAGDPRLLSLPAAFPRLAALEHEHGSVLRGLSRDRRRRRREAKALGIPPPGNKLWSFTSGMQRLPDALRERLRQPPVVGASVRKVVRPSANPGPGEGWQVHLEGKDALKADAVVLACPAYRQAALLEELDPELAQRIAGIAYNRVAVVAVGYRRTDVPFPLDGFGYLSRQRDRRDVLGVQWCSSIFPDRAPAGLVLLRAMCGGWHRPEIVDWDEDRLLRAVREELALALGIRAQPVFHHVVRWDRAIPQYQLGHLERVAWITERAERHPGLYPGGNAYRGVALNDCVEQAGALAEKVTNGLRRQRVFR